MYDQRPSKGRAAYEVDLSARRKTKLAQALGGGIATLYRNHAREADSREVGETDRFARRGHRKGARHC